MMNKNLDKRMHSERGLYSFLMHFLLTAQVTGEQGCNAIRKLDLLKIGPQKTS